MSLQLCVSHALHACWITSKACLVSLAPFHHISLSLPKAQRLSNNIEHVGCFYFLLFFSFLNSSKDHCYPLSIACLTMQIEVLQLVIFPPSSFQPCISPQDHGSSGNFNFCFSRFISLLRF